MNRPRKYFADLDLSWLRGSCVVLDIDGTLVEHDGAEVNERAHRQIRMLVSNENRVCLVSNNENAARGERLARSLGLEWSAEPYRKPDRRALPPELAACGLPIVVIGDKLLTDGLFARRVGARFVKTRIVRGLNDPWNVRLHYLIDWIAERFVRSV